MSALDQMVRLHRWQLDEKRRKLAQLEALADRIVRDIEALETGLADEQARATSDAGAVTLPAFAASCAARRRALEQSLAAIRKSADLAREELHEAFREVKTYETAVKTREERARNLRAKRERAVLDEVGLTQHIRGQADGR